MRYARLVSALLLAAIVLLVLATLLFVADPASALTVSGGTVEQRGWVREAIEAQQGVGFTETDSYFRGGVNVEIVEHFDPYWELAAGTEVYYDIFPAGAVGVAWPGQIRIITTYSPGPHSFLGEIAVHEFGHQDWFGPLRPQGRTDWVLNQSPGDSVDWYHSPAESYTEQFRVANWSDVYYQTAGPRTQLRVLGNQAFLAWRAGWRDNPYPTTTTTVASTTTTTTSGSTTTTTILRGDPFSDITRDDIELWDAAWWAKGMFIGYPDGTFGSYEALLRRHVALVVDRWTGLTDALEPWVDDWSPATRSDVRLAVPGLEWREARWVQEITRSQMLRLMYRGVSP